MVGDPLQKVNNYLDEMNNYDPDLQQMGAKYLCDLVLGGSINLMDNPELARKITENYLKQVGSQSFAVHSAAIRFLAEMVPKLPPQELVHVFNETISAIAKVHTPAERREVFSTAAGTMIHLAPDEHGTALSHLLVQSIQHLLKSKGEHVDIQMLLLNVITEFTRKWPNVTGSKSVVFDREKLIEYLLRNIESSMKLQLVKKSDGALSKLSLIFNKNNIDFLLNSPSFGLLDFIRKNKNASSEQQMKYLRNGTLTLANILKTQNHELKYWIREVIPLCTNVIKFYGNQDTHLELTAQIIQNVISCLTSILKVYSSEISELLMKKNSPLTDFVEEYLNFDLENMMMILQDEEEMEGEEYQYEEEDYYMEDSVCWKVRAATLRYVTVLMHKNKQFREETAKSEHFLNLLATKLIEENEKVSTMAFECFNQIIQSISTQQGSQDDEEELGLKRVKSTEGDFALKIIEQVSDQIAILFRHKKTKEASKTQASKIMLRIVELLHERIVEHEDMCLRLLNQVQVEIKNVKTDSCINFLKVIKELISGVKKFSTVKQTLSILLNYTKNNNLKIVSISYGGIGTILKHFSSELLDSGAFSNILANILGKLKEHDADRNVKSSVISCLGPIFENIYLSLKDQTKTQLLQSVIEKIKIQIDKSLLLHQVSRIPENYVIKYAHVPHFHNLLELASENIGTANFELNANAILCCQKLIILQKNHLKEAAVEHILKKSRSLFYESKIPRFIDILLDSYPKSFTNYVEIIIRTADKYYIEKLLNYKIINKNKCIDILRNVAKPENSKKISQILSSIGVGEQDLIKSVNQEQWGLISLGALGYVGKEKTVGFVMKVMEGGKSEEIKLEAARALGNIASRHTKLALDIISMIKKTDDQYLFIFAIKEMLLFRNSQFPEFPQIITWLFERANDSSKQSNHYLISESIGRIARISPVECKKIISSVDTMTVECKFIVANSLRYMLENVNEDDITDESTENYVEKVIGMIKEKDVKVRTGATKSVNSIIHSFHQLVKSNINDQLLRNLMQNMTINPDLIKIVDYGVNKEKIDTGKPMRNETFNLLKNILELRKVEGFYEEILRRCLERLNQQSSNDLVLKRANIIKRICEKDFTIFMALQHEFVLGFGVEEGILKQYQSEKQTDERNETFIKSLFKEIIEIKNISQRENSEKIKGMVNSIKSVPRYFKMLESLQLN